MVDFQLFFVVSSMWGRSWTAHMWPMTNMRSCNWWSMTMRPMNIMRPTNYMRSVDVSWVTYMVGNKLSWCCQRFY